MCRVSSDTSSRPPPGGCRNQCESSDCLASTMRSEGGAYAPTSDLEEQPISRTYQYRKVMKPMLERKRRARINRCLDELKELMVGALAAEGENVSKLEKADILELTVRHLHRLRRTQRLALNPDADRFRAGFTHCAAEVSRYLGAVTTSVPAAAAVTAGGSVETHVVGARLLTHLGHCLQSIEKPGQRHQPPSPPPVPAATAYAYNTPPTSPQPLATSADCPAAEKLPATAEGSVWRPW